MDCNKIAAHVINVIVDDKSCLHEYSNIDEKLASLKLELIGEPQLEDNKIAALFTDVNV